MPAAITDRSARSPTTPTIPAKAIPTVVLRNEDYGRISRLLADRHAVELEFDIVNRMYPEGRTSYNAIAEIPGATDEVVMLGGHLDSWHAATGATDNAIGCAVVDGSRAHSESDRHQAAAHDSCCALERRRAGAARIARLRSRSSSAPSKSRSRHSRDSAAT